MSRGLDNILKINLCLCSSCFSLQFSEGIQRFSIFLLCLGLLLGESQMMLKGGGHTPGTQTVLGGVGGGVSIYGRRDGRHPKAGEDSSAIISS